MILGSTTGLVEHSFELSFRTLVDLDLLYLSRSIFALLLLSLLRLEGSTVFDPVIDY